MIEYFQQVQRIVENAFIDSTGTKMVDYFQQHKVQYISSTGVKGVHETKY